MTATRRDDRGSGTVLVVGVLCCLAMFVAAAICIAGYALAAHRARASADLAALAGAGAVSSGRDGCATARRVAAANDAQLSDCGVVGDQQAFVVTATTRVEVSAMLPGLPGQVTATAHAGSLSPGSEPPESAPP